MDVTGLSPIYRSPQADNSYDISGDQEIDPVFGTLSDFDELLADVHRCGMKLIMDLVVNHTSDKHPWFTESRSRLDTPNGTGIGLSDGRQRALNDTSVRSTTQWSLQFSACLQRANR